MKKKNDKKHQILKIVVCVFLALLLLLTSLAPLFADELDDLQEERDALNEEKQATQYEQTLTAEQISVIMANIEETNAQIAVLDGKITQCAANMKELQTKIDANEALIAENQTALVTAQAQEQVHYEELKSRLKMMYEYGSVNYLEVLFGSKSISDFFSRIEYVAQMAEYDKQIQTNLENDRLEIQKIETTLEQTQLELDMNRSSLEAEQAQLNMNMEEKTRQYQSLVADEESAQQYMIYLQGKEMELQAMIMEKEQAISNEQARRAAAAEAARLAAEEEARKAAAQEAARAAEEAARQQQSYYSSGTFMWPSDYTWITSEYGYRIHPIYGYELKHSGVDIGATMYSNVYAADGGTVIWAGSDDWSGYGTYVMISHPSGYTTLYGHCDSLLVYNGQTVSKGEVIAYSGSTGNSTGPHLHFEVRVNGQTVDPMSFFN